MRVYTTDGIAERAGVSYRQIDYWLSRGFITSSELDGKPADSNPGTGHTRVWVGEDAEAVVAFARLVNAGMKPNRIGGAHIRLARGEKVHLPFGLCLSLEGGVR